MGQTFGCLGDGAPVQLERLRAPGGLDVDILSYGAIVKSLRVPVGSRLIDTVIGFDTLAAYEADRTYQGCVVGRLVNRVGNAEFTRGPRRYTLARNDGKHNLHGGLKGLSRRNWTIDARQDDEAPVIARHVSPDGEEGFPGNLDVAVTFSLPTPMTLAIQYEATLDAPGPVDLTHHLYFNLADGPDSDVGRHYLAVGGDRILELDSDFIPTGLVLPVGSTPFDLTEPVLLDGLASARHPQLNAFGFNSSWILTWDGRPAAALWSPRKNMRLSLETDQPCLQVYTGLPRDVFPAGAVALEPQGYPDAVNHRAFPDPWLRPGEIYSRTTTYTFTGN